MGESPFKSPAPALRFHPAAVRSNSRSPTRSSKRRSLFLADELDPLLSNLSPHATLNALSATDAVPGNRDPAHDSLTKSISDVSTVDRAFGIRAAVAAQKLKEWLTEVLSWDWPQGAESGPDKGFLPPTKKPGTTVHSSNTATNDSAEVEEEYLGCLPAKIVKKYEDRIEEIKDGMDDLGVDELKEHVLTVHIASRSRPASSNSACTNNSMALNYTKLSDFTAVITATILGALPVLYRLNVLLSTWDVRLSVLRQVPALIVGLNGAKKAIKNALNRLKGGVLPDIDDSLFSRESFGVARQRLEKLISSLGSRMDGILDMLEGREEALPDVWIDDMEDVESGFATWAFEAEKRAVENQWRCKKLQEKKEKDATVEAKKSEPTKDKTLATETPKENAADNSSLRGKSAGYLASSEKAQCPTSSQPTCASSPVSNGKPVQLKIPDQADPIEPSPSQSIQDNDQTASSGLIAKVPDPTDDTPKVDIRSESIDDSNNPSPLINHTVISQTPQATEAALRPIPPAKENAPPSENNNRKSTGREISHKPPSRTPLTTSNILPAKSNTKPLKLNSTPPHRESNSKSEDTIHPPLVGHNKGKKPTPKPLQLHPPGNEIRHRPLSSSSAGSSSITCGSNPEVGAALVAESHGIPTVINSPGLGSTDNPIIDSHRDVNFDKDAAGLDTILPLETDPSSGSRPTVHRSISLPLARYVSDDSDIKDQGGYSETNINQIRKASVASFEVFPKAELRSITINRRASLKPPDTPVKQNHELRRSASSLDISSAQRLKQKVTRGPLSGMFGLSSPKRSSAGKASSQPLPPSPGSPDSTVMPSKAKRPASKLRPDHQAPSQKPNNHIKEKSLNHATVGSTKAPYQSTLKTPTRSPEDHLDKKINTLLNTIPTRIRLGPASDRDPDRSTGTADTRPPNRTERMQSASPTPSRSSTPTPSLTLTPAVSRPKRRHVHTEDESSVRLYHLHRGGKLAPIKLFVRLVGDGERVMVRVGGGWADLGEYLREYAMHHGRRNISEGRFELQDIIPSNGSPSTYSRNTRATTPTNGRTTPGPPSRPGSAFDVRPSSSLAVRKTRRSTGAHGANLPNLTAANIQKATEESAGPSHSPFLPSRRRLSVSSTNSMSMSSAFGDTRALSTATGPASIGHSTPLGLAGPKPRSRQVSISPESEAWVEDVVGQARMSSATLRSQRSNSALRPLRETEDNNERSYSRVGKVRSNSNLRSVSDMGSVSLNKRVFLRRMSKGKE